MMGQLERRAKAISGSSTRETFQKTRLLCALGQYVLLHEPADWAEQRAQKLFKNQNQIFFPFNIIFLKKEK
jgi:hypothetical protein